MTSLSRISLRRFRVALVVAAIVLGGREKKPPRRSRRVCSSDEPSRFPARDSCGTP
jgi:hypothetical protein